MDMTRALTPVARSASLAAIASVVLGVVGAGPLAPAPARAGTAALAASAPYRFDPAYSATLGRNFGQHTQRLIIDASQPVVGSASVLYDPSQVELTFGTNNRPFGVRPFLTYGPGYDRIGYDVTNERGYRGNTAVTRVGFIELGQFVSPGVYTDKFLLPMEDVLEVGFGGPGRGDPYNDFILGLNFSPSGYAQVFFQFVAALPVSTAAPFTQFAVQDIGTGRRFDPVQQRIDPTPLGGVVVDRAPPLRNPDAVDVVALDFSQTFTTEFPCSFLMCPQPGDPIFAEPTNAYTVYADDGRRGASIDLRRYNVPPGSLTRGDGGDVLVGLGDDFIPFTAQGEDLASARVSVIPLPAAAWTGLSTLAATAALATRRRAVA